MMTCRFGVCPYPNGSASWFEVFDRTTGAAVARGLTRSHAEIEARRRNHDTSGPPVLYLGPPDVAQLRRGEQQTRAVLARAAQALDELRDALAHADRLIAQQQHQLGELYDLLTSGDR